MGRVFAWHVKVLDSVANNTDENNKDYLFSSYTSCLYNESYRTGTLGVLFSQRS